MAPTENQPTSPLNLFLLNHRIRFTAFLVFWFKSATQAWFWFCLVLVCFLSKVSMKYTAFLLTLTCTIIRLRIVVTIIWSFFNITKETFFCQSILLTFGQSHSWSNDYLFFLYMILIFSWIFFGNWRWLILRNIIKTSLSLMLDWIPAKISTFNCSIEFYVFCTLLSVVSMWILSYAHYRVSCTVYFFQSFQFFLKLKILLLEL